MTQVTYSKWERGITDPYPLHVHKLCKVFGKTAIALDLIAKPLPLQEEARFMGKLPTAKEEEERTEQHSFSPKEDSNLQELQASEQNPAVPVLRIEEAFVPSESEELSPLGLCIETLPRETAPVDLVTWFGTKVSDLKAYGAFWAEPMVTSQQQACIHAELMNWNVMTDQDQQSTNEYFITRRTALAALATLPASLLARVRFGPLTALVIEEFLAQCATSLTTCWHLLNGDSIATVGYSLPEYLSLLIALARQPSQYQKRAAYLGSQGSLLMGLIEYHQFRFEKWLAFCNQAVNLAKMSGDSNLHTYALLLLGSALGHSGQSEAFLQRLQEAAQHLKEVVPLLGSHVLAQLSLAYAQNGLAQDALHSIDEARNLFSDEIENVPYFIAADYGIFSLLLFEGRVHLALKEKDKSKAVQHSENAKTSLIKVEKLAPTIVIPQRLSAEVMNYRTEAAIGRDMEEFKQYLGMGAHAAKALASEKRRQEAISNWKAAREQWPHEKSILELADVLF